MARKTHPDRRRRPQRPKAPEVSVCLECDLVARFRGPICPACLAAPEATGRLHEFAAGTTLSR